ncbi:MAG TPA: histidine kinase [Candidatus Polarisedimenticolia bacterium]|jgi:signal transduction histidine kinase|nr:histidine kinase [Candidatus Polarisedimenticolia bacterium]
MIPRSTPFGFQVLLWALGNSLAGAAVGLAVNLLGRGVFEPTVLVIGILFGNVVGFTVFLTSTLLPPRLREVGPWLRALLVGLALFSGAVAGTALAFYLFPLFVLRDLRQALTVGAINAVLALAVGSVVHVYEALRWRLAESLREVEEVRLREARLREQAALAELAALQARINPHFFFNTLNTISSLVEEDPRRAGDIVTTLAELFRYTFRAAESRPVRLEEELDFVRRYLTIEQARFGERLRVVSDVTPAALQVPVPGLLLQPLVENAVGHGVATLRRGGTVRIAARVDSDELVVEVSDDGRGLPPHGDPIRPGHGLDNVRQRLATLYGERGRLTLQPGDEGQGAVATIRIPAPAAPSPEATAPAAAGIGAAALPAAAPERG